jgi:hypothetical protein
MTQEQQTKLLLTITDTFDTGLNDVNKPNMVYNYKYSSIYEDGKTTHTITFDSYPIVVDEFLQKYISERIENNK